MTRKTVAQRSGSKRHGPLSFLITFSSVHCCSVSVHDRRLPFRRWPPTAFPVLQSGFRRDAERPKLIGTLAHEVLHPALQHHTRRGDRDRKRWNMACDFAINPLLLDAGLTLPKDVLIDHRFRGMSAERIYNLIEEQGTAPSEQSTSVKTSTDGGRDDAPSQPNQGESEPSAPLRRADLAGCLMLRSPQERTATAWLDRRANGR